jgi:putative SOS response-associated peptidase YedK
MCTAYSIGDAAATMRLARSFAEADADVAPITVRWKVRPTEAVPVAYAGDRCRVGPMNWGLRVRWGGPEVRPTLLTCARSETLPQKVSFREAVRRRRGLMFATSFFELRDRKWPHRFALRTGEPFCMAALWEPGSGAEPARCVLVTTAANVLVRPIHDRMPVMLGVDVAREWLGCEPLPAGRLEALCQPPVADTMASHAVDPRLLTRGFDGPACVAPWAPEPELF